MAEMCREDADVGGGNAVAIGVFYQVHRFVGEVQQAFFGESTG